MGIASKATSTRTSKTSQIIKKPEELILLVVRAPFCDCSRPVSKISSAHTTSADFETKVLGPSGQPCTLKILNPNPERSSVQPRSFVAVCSLASKSPQPRLRVSRFGRL